MRHGWNGLLLIDKPTGPTSHAVVNGVRRAIGQRRVGHAGTLDPMASGLLPVVVGCATRLVRFLPSSPKVYEGTLRLGLTTDSDDVTGETLTRHDGPLPTPDETMATAREFLGQGQQVPPTISARKVGGRRMYKLARAGVAVAPKATPVDIRSFRLEPDDSDDTYRFVAEVSGGTYIRALARDLGARLGCGGVLASLRRTKIGPMELPGIAGFPFDGEAAPLLRSALLPPERMPMDLVRVELTDSSQALGFRQGRFLPGPHLDSGTTVQVIGSAGELLGIAEIRDGQLLPRVVLDMGNGAGNDPAKPAADDPAEPTAGHPPGR